ncbi:4-coumarate--CoA ligase [Sulfolobus sp. A20]|uniref:class I adenylate-forming enzyme family protein n=1 Tax=Sulfolobaceae TaxID=118883 RepID=UPI00084612C5|nr:MULTISPECIES: class I adenylate-forming enzyme family protein [unclassified Sulfolobus]TRM74291.1 long-chain fatty acid--CoA ligase [Sulfolobus sp. A20-N-F8]TRM76220.1 long-chain fatty acid--CoA ligase [Sulfolobus sp. B5]TRM85032.1 long-chain fatty acid--CoA ligase [Sulfolobus sp. F3]TRM86529.1 long-chain fatty acid--CoA ligase [Sulfolobus sp. C3]TRM87262.1 long-chain fatty acid--CoA ligase [Sulfolobus sp. E3]TRM98378.1 long-chain fatty acid--CoA ligase [Sulfolobus sp. F1]TRM98432.1 long-
MSIWSKFYPKDLDLKIPEEPAYYFLEKASKEKGDSTFLVYENKEYTYNNLYSLSRRFSNYLQQEGLKKGDAIALIMYNSPLVIPIIFGSFIIGVRVALIDPLTSGKDLEYQLSLTNPKIIVTEDEILKREREILSSRYKVLSLNSESDLSRLSASEEVTYAKVNPREDIAVSMHYAGIIGRTYEVYHTHFGLIASNYVSTSVRSKEIGEGNTILISLPIAHIFGLNALLGSMIEKGKVVLLRRYDKDRVLESLDKYKVNIWPAPPLVFKEVYDNLKKEKFSLKLCITGAAPVPPELQKIYFEELGLPLVQVYGLTEGLAVTYQPSNLKVYGSVGIPLPTVEIKLVDKETGTREVPIGQEGELIVKSPWNMKGYGSNGVIDLNETNKAIRNGWLYTGDIFVMDHNGLLYFKGLKKRFLKYKAYPILPRDLEIILESHPAVKKAYVDGELDPEVGHRVFAKVVLKDEYKGKVSEEELLNYVNEKVAFYKKIRKIIFVDSL